MAAVTGDWRLILQDGAFAFRRTAKWLYIICLGSYAVALLANHFGCEYKGGGALFPELQPGCGAAPLAALGKFGAGLSMFPLLGPVALLIVPPLWSIGLIWVTWPLAVLARKRRVATALEAAPAPDAPRASAKIPWFFLIILGLSLATIARPWFDTRRPVHPGNFIKPGIPAADAVNLLTGLGYTCTAIPAATTCTRQEDGNTLHSWTMTTDAQGVITAESAKRERLP